MDDDAFEREFEALRPEIEARYAIKLGRGFHESASPSVMTRIVSTFVAAGRWWRTMDPKRPGCENAPCSPTSPAPPNP